MLTAESSEIEFAKVVSSLRLQRQGQRELLNLLHEDHPVYNGRSAAAVVRMRGWILLSLAHLGLPEQAVVFILEELDTGRDPYLVAVAARALRSYRATKPAFAPFVTRAIRNIRYHDEPIALDEYGYYAMSSSHPTPVRELLTTLQWLGSSAVNILPELEDLRQDGHGLIRKLHADLDKTIEAIRNPTSRTETESDCCCGCIPGFPNGFTLERNSCDTQASIKSVVLEDQYGTKIGFYEFFYGRPTIVAFFYTRCDNPQKCSLTIAKLARIQKLVAVRGFSSAIRIAAITYDPGFDTPARLLQYGESRGFRTDQDHRLFRTVKGFNRLRSHFHLGVNFVGSIVNRHRIELYVLDHTARIAWTFQRVHYREENVVSRAIIVLQEQDQGPKNNRNVVTTSKLNGLTSPTMSTIASVAFAFFPKCPLCWATYISFFGVSWLHKIPYPPHLHLLFAFLLLINIWTVWTRSQVTRQVKSFGLVLAGAILLILAKLIHYPEFSLGLLGIALTSLGSFISIYAHPPTSASNHPTLTAGKRNS